jgi:hypothetical protein
MRSRPRSLVVSILALCLLLVAPILAQNATLTTGQTFTLSADHDGVNTTAYRVYVDDAQVGPDIPVSALANGTVTTSPLPALAEGTHAVRLAAVGPGGETKSDPLSIVVTLPPPSKPTNLRITAVVSIGADGRVQLRIEQLAALADPPK